jgi:hypothetical protein
MTRDKAERVATLVMGVAAVAAAYVVLRNPSLRRGVWHVARGAIAASGPWLMTEARQAWGDTAAPPARALAAPEGQRPAI